MVWRRRRRYTTQSIELGGRFSANSKFMKCTLDKAKIYRTDNDNPCFALNTSFTIYTYLIKYFNDIFVARLNYFIFLHHFSTVLEYKLNLGPV